MGLRGGVAAFFGPLAGVAAPGSDHRRGEPYGEVLVVLQGPKVIKARKILPVIVAARCTKPVCPALASLWSVDKHSVSLGSVLGHGSAIAVSFASQEDDTPLPSSHERETATSPENSRVDPVPFMPMGSRPTRRLSLPRFSPHLILLWGLD